MGVLKGNVKYNICFIINIIDKYVVIDKFIGN